MARQGEGETALAETVERCKLTKRNIKSIALQVVRQAQELAEGPGIDLVQTRAKRRPVSAIPPCALRCECVREYAFVHSVGPYGCRHLPRAKRIVRCFCTADQASFFRRQRFRMQGLPIRAISNVQTSESSDESEESE
jgi:hypothetical protein